MGAMQVLWLAILAAATASAKRFVFGSCSDPTVLNAVAFASIAAEKPDHVLLGGDAAYGDDAGRGFFGLGAREFKTPTVEEMSVLFGKTRALLPQGVPIDAVMDDHDYGRNDANAASPSAAEKDAYKSVFMRDLLHISPHDPRNYRNGSYHSFYDEETKIQFIFLDVRYFADENGLLGKEQWIWLESQLCLSAMEYRHDLQKYAPKPKILEERMAVAVVSPIPVLSDGNSTVGFDGWSLMPFEKTKLLRMMTSCGVPSPIFLSGNGHVGEVSSSRCFSKQFDPTDFVEIGSSGLTHSKVSNPWLRPLAVVGARAWHFNKFREVGSFTVAPNYAVLDVVGKVATAHLKNADGTIIYTKAIPLGVIMRGNIRKCFPISKAPSSDKKKTAVVYDSMSERIYDGLRKAYGHGLTGVFYFTLPTLLIFYILSRILFPNAFAEVAEEPDESEEEEESKKDR